MNNLGVKRTSEQFAAALQRLAETPDSGFRVQNVRAYLAEELSRIVSPEQEILRLMNFGEGTFLQKIPDIVRLMMELDDKQTDRADFAIRSYIERSFFGNPRLIYTGEHAKNFLRYREQLLMWVSPKEYRNMLAHCLRYHIDNKTLGPVNDASQFLAMYYDELMQAYPGDTELSEMMVETFNAFDRWPVLYAFMSPDRAPKVTTSREFPGDDDVLDLDAVHAAKRTDKRYTSCCPQAEAGHLHTSFSSQRGNNTFVYCQGHLIGSLKHNDDDETDHTVQNTFVGLRTVRRRDAEHGDTYPVVEGGLYLVSDFPTLAKIKASGDRADLDTLSLMPIRTLDTNFVSAADFAKRAREIRKERDSA